MPGTLRAYDGISTKQWNAFIDRSDQSLVFHRSEWLEVLSGTQNSALKLFGLASEAQPEELVGVMPVLLGRFGPFRVGGSPLVVEDTPYMGPVVSEELTAAALMAVRDELAREASFFRVLLPHALSLPATRALEAAGFTVTTKRTHRLDLEPGIPALWDQMEGRCRTAVRRARKSGVESRRVMDAGEGDLRAYFSMVEEVFGRQDRRPPNPWEFYRQLWERMQPGGALTLLMASVDGEDVAGVLLARDRHRVYYIDGASSYEHRKLNASNLVLWDAVEWAASAGAVELDFVGSDIPRLARFKASFGGRLVEHSCVEWARSRAVWVARDWWGRHGRALLGRIRNGKRKLTGGLG